MTIAVALALFGNAAETRNTKKTRSHKTADASSLQRLVSNKIESIMQKRKGVVRLPGIPEREGDRKFGSYWAQAADFRVTTALRDIKEPALSPEEIAKLREDSGGIEKNEANIRRVKPAIDPSLMGPIADMALDTLKARSFRNLGLNVVSNPIQSFDGPDIDFVSTLFGGRFAPPDTNAAVGPNHVVITTNSVVQVFNKSGTPLTAAVKISSLLTGVPNATDDDGDPIVLYDALADRWLVSQFDVTHVTNNSTHEHIAISKTSDPTGQYFAYDFLMVPNRPADYPHLGVWSDGYYMSTNDFSLPVFSSPFQGAGLYAFEREKMLVGDPTAKIIGFSTTANDGGMLPSNLQGYTTPPTGTPNLFMEFLADEFGFPADALRIFEFHADFDTPANSTLTQRTDIPVSAFDARSPATRAVIQQPAPGEGLDNIADRLMHPLNFRVLPGGVQSFVLNWTVNVSGVNPTNSATYQGGVRWMELRRDAGTGAVTINQEATYAPGSANPTGRDLWMASVAQDGEGNIALGASASAPGPNPAALNPTAIYTGRLAGDPANTFPQGEIDALAAVTKGVQIGTSSRWGDYSSLFVDPADDCTFWGAFEYVDSPTATFDWNTRIFSFKVNPTCVTSPHGTINGTITNCQNGQPINGASVETTSPEGFFRQTNASGNYSIDRMTPGTYSLEASGGPSFLPASGMATVAGGGTATVNLCLAPQPQITTAGATISAESCTPADGKIDPGELVTVSFCVQNTGALDTTNLTGTLQPGGGVSSPSGPQNYGVVVAGGASVCRNFTFTVDPNVACGNPVTATIHFQDGMLDLGNITYNFSTGTATGLTSGVTYSSGNIAVAIPDNNATGIDIPITVPDSGVVGDVNVKIRLNHTFDGDLDIRLVAPDNTTFLLSDNRGGSGDNYGSGTNDCAGTGTSFDDAATVGISAGAAPFAGTFKPDQPLSGFNGHSMNGTWKVHIADTANLDTGTVGCVQLQLRAQLYFCCGVAGTPLINPVPPPVIVSETCNPNNGGIDPNENVTMSFALQNMGSAATTNLVATLQSTGGVISPSGPQNYGALSPIGPSAARNFSFVPQGSCGSTITATFHLQDGVTDLGNVSFNIRLGATTTTNATFSNATSITIPNPPSTGVSTGAPANPYPSDVTVAGLTGTVTGVAVTLTNLNHTFPDDVDLLLVGPTGRKMIIMSDVGATNDWVNQTITLTDAAANFMSDASANPTGSYKPTNIGVADAFPAPAPASPYLSAGPAGTDTFASAFAGQDPNGTWSLYAVDDLGGDTGNMAGGWTLTITTETTSCCVPTCTLFCPQNITVSSEPNQCGAVVTYPAPTTTGNCGTVTCTPPSGSFFPVGTTPVRCTASGGEFCEFNVIVNDTQPPTITCPPNITAISPTPGGPTAVTYPAPIVTDNCPGVVVACTPPSGSLFQPGTTIVTCTATDPGGNTASCSFTISVFDVALDDDSGNGVLLWVSGSGAYRYCTGGTIFTGIGTPTNKGSTFTLTHNPQDRRLSASYDASTKHGSAGMQVFSMGQTFTILDRITTNNTFLCPP